MNKMKKTITDLWNTSLESASQWSKESSTGADEDWAYARFFGKDQDEALELLKFNAMSYIEDLGVMPKPAFRFYLKVLVEYLLSDKLDEDLSAGAASSMFALIRYDIESGQHKIAGLESFLPSVLRAVADRQEFYDADTDIFGDFRQEAEELIKLLEST